MIEVFSLDYWLDGRNLIGCYEGVFGSSREKYLEKCDFVLINKDPIHSNILGFLTCHELDSETIYWQFGGIHKDFQKSIHVSSLYLEAIIWCKERYKRITTRIENTNIAMLKLAMKYGFLILGTYNFKGKIYLELCNEFGG